MRSLVPENRIQWFNWILGIRLLTPGRASFTSLARCLNAKPGGMDSSIRMEQFLSFGPDFCYPAGVMY